MVFEGVNGVFMEVEKKGAWIIRNLQTRARFWRSKRKVNVGIWTKPSGISIKVSNLTKSVLKGVFLQKKF